MAAKKKILCAMSGGVDSSVAALILKQRGFEVVGIFMNFWSEKNENIHNKCCSIESARIAREVTSKLKIRLYSLNFKEIFKKKIVEYFIQGYENGITPNPCIICNREIKFGKLLKIAHDLKTNKIATGHYARIIKTDTNFELHRGIDKKKDQSYFLWRIPYQSLSSVSFPIGNLRKSDVRKLAKKFKLPTSDKKDSQGLCFVGESNSSFLKKFAQRLLEPGNVVNNRGNIIGKHNGLAMYTVGQRTGFETTNDKWRKNKCDVPPLYVIELIPSKNLLVVGENHEVFSRRLIVSQLNWLNNSFSQFSGERDILAQIRYQHNAKPCTISYQKNNKLLVIFKNPERAITPGQSCVFYDNNQVIGGGFIEK